MDTEKRIRELEDAVEDLKEANEMLHRERLLLASNTDDLNNEGLTYIEEEEEKVHITIRGGKTEITGKASSMEITEKRDFSLLSDMAELIPFFIILLVIMIFVGIMMTRLLNWLGLLP